jgi:hypothetical protein
MTNNTVTLIIEGTESSLPIEDLNIERIIAEAHAVGYQEFSVFCNDKEIKGPDDLKVIAGAIYYITPPESEFDINEIIEVDKDGTE